MSIDYSTFTFSKDARIVNVKLLKTKEHKCELCGKMAITAKHHIKTKGSGGNDVSENLVELCPICHEKAHKGNISKKDLKDIVKNRKGK